MRMLKDALGDSVSIVVTNPKPISNPNNIQPDPDIVIVSGSAASELELPGLTDAYQAVHNVGLYTIYAKPDIARKHGIIKMGPFFGQRHMIGFNPKGRHRVATQNRSIVRFPSARVSNKTLRIRCIKRGTEPRRIRVRFNGKTLPGGAICNNTKRFTEHRFQVQLRKGSNNLWLHEARGTQFSMIRLEQAQPGKGGLR